MVAEYDRGGIRFSYPDNWTIFDESVERLPATVSLQSPGTAFWTLGVYPHEKGPRTVAAEALKELQAEYDGVESEPIDEEWESIETVGYEMRFFHVELIVACRVVAFRAGGRTWITWWQAEDSEFEALTEVFRAMTVSLLRSGRDEPAR